MSRRPQHAPPDPVALCLLAWVILQGLQGGGVKHSLEGARGGGEEELGAGLGHDPAVRRE